MKSRTQELVEKSIAAMMSAIEIYNKPDFKYREETFAILALNAWELLLKAKWLQLHGNSLKSLYVMEKRFKVNGKPYKYSKPKITSCGNPMTHGLDYLAKQLFEKEHITYQAVKNLEAVKEIRDSAVHFYHKNKLFALQLQEVGSACVRNYVRTGQLWFDVDFGEYNFYLMPLAFLNPDQSAEGLFLRKEEKNLSTYIQSLEAANDDLAEDSVTINIDVKYSRSKSADALLFQLTSDPDAPKLQLSEQQMRDRYPLTYDSLTNECKQRYSDFKQNHTYHSIRKPLKEDQKFCMVRRLDPTNPNSLKTEWYSRAIFTELDRHYKKRN